MSKMSIRAKLFWGLGLAFLVGSSLFILVSSTSIRRLIYDSALQNLKDDTALVRDLLDSSMDAAVKNYLRGIAEKTLALEDGYYQSSLSGKVSDAAARKMFAATILSPSFGKIGDTGYIAVLDSKGIAVIHPKAQGKDLSYVDAVQKAMKLKQGYFKYQFQNPGEDAPREKVAYVLYFAPWDSLIFVSSYISEFTHLVDLNDVRDKVLAIHLGKTGYPYVMDYSGTLLIHPSLEGKNVSDSKDENGRYFIKEILGQDKGVVAYPWKNPGETKAREKFVYFERDPALKVYIAVSAYDEELYSTADSVVWYIVIGMSLTLVGLLLVVFLLSRAITRPIRTIQDTINRSLIQGDLTETLAIHSGDEIGLMSKDFNAFVAKLKDLIGQMRGMSLENRSMGSQLSRKLEDSMLLLGKLSSATDEIGTALDEFAGVVAQSTSATEEISATATSFTDRIAEQAEAVARTSSSIEQISASIANVARIVSGRQAAEESLKNLTAEGLRLSQETVATVGRFAESADAMQGMTRTINAVAAQTGLLAMNAAIEAAHAGEYGRGFAVVADEIRKLAESTAKESKQISESLKLLLAQVGLAGEASGKSGEAFRTIARDVDSSVDASRRISAAIEELALGSREILSSTESLSRITDEIRGGSQEIRQGTDQIRDAFGLTRGAMSRTSEALALITGDVMEVNLAQLAISGLNVRANQAIESLQAGISGFRTGCEDEAQDYSALDIPTIRLAHREWVLKTNMALTGAVKLDAEAAGDSHACALGTWLYQQGGLERYAGFGPIRELESRHDAMHAAVAGILRLIAEKGRLDDIDAKKQRLKELSSGVVELLDQMEKYSPCA